MVICRHVALLATLLELLVLSAVPADAEWVRRCDRFGCWREEIVRRPERRDPTEYITGCRDTRNAVGDQHLTIDGAKKAANDAWAGTIRFHLGEKFMDLGYARRVVYTCSRSSIKEGGVTTLGQTFTRCEVEAQPCPAPRVRGEKGD